MFWPLVLGLLYSGFLLFYREARPIVRAGFVLLLIFAPPILSGFSGFPPLDPQGFGYFLAKVMNYYMKIMGSFVEASSNL